MQKNGSSIEDFLYKQTRGYEKTERKVQFCVVCAHALVILLILQGAFTAAPKKLPTKLLVRTVSLQREKIIEKEPPQIIAIIEPSPPSEEALPPPSLSQKKEETNQIETKAPAPLKKQKTPPKKLNTAQKQKKITPKDTPHPKKISQPEKTPIRKSQTPIRSKKEVQEEERNRALIADALSSLEKIDSLSSQKKSIQTSNNQTLTKAPKRIGKLSSESLIAFKDETSALYSTQEKSYVDELVYRLKRTLTLPEYGDVKIKITVSSQGKVVKVEIISTKSKKNREYLEKMLSSLTLPPFGGNFLGEKEHIFLFNLSNDLTY